MIFLYNFRCRTRIAGGLMIRDYVANQSKDNNKKPPLYGVVFIKSEKFYVVLLITFLYLPYIIVLPIFPPLFLSPYYFISPTYSSLPP